MCVWLTDWMKRLVLWRESRGWCVSIVQTLCVCVRVDGEKEGGGCDWGVWGVCVNTQTGQRQSAGWWGGGGSASLRGLIVSSICQRKGLFYFCNDDDDDDEDGDVCKFAGVVRVSGRHKELWGVTAGVWRETHAEHSPTHTHQR